LNKTYEFVLKEYYC